MNSISVRPVLPPITDTKETLVRNSKRILTLLLLYIPVLFFVSLLILLYMFNVFSAVGENVQSNPEQLGEGIDVISNITEILAYTILTIFIGILIIGMLMFAFYCFVFITIYKIGDGLDNLTQYNSNLEKTAGRAAILIRFALLSLILSTFFIDLMSLTWALFTVAAFFVVKMFEQLRVMNAFNRRNNWTLVVGAASSSLLYLYGVFDSSFSFNPIRNDIAENEYFPIQVLLLLLTNIIFLIGIYQFNHNIRSIDEHRIPSYSFNNQQSYGLDTQSPNAFLETSSNKQNLEHSEFLEENAKVSTTQLDINYCLKCGSKLRGHNRFCAHCGEKVS